MMGPVREQEGPKDEKRPLTEFLYLLKKGPYFHVNKGNTPSTNL